MTDVLIEKVRDGAFADDFQTGDFLYGPGDAKVIRRGSQEAWLFPNGKVLPKAQGAQGGGTATGHPQPQTTSEAPGGPFIRHSQPGRAPQYNVTGVAFSSVVTQPLVARPGYFRHLRVKPTITTSANAAAVTAAADSPANLFTLVQLKDGFGTPLIIAPGFETFKLIPIYSGTYGPLGQNPDPFTLPSGNQATFTNGISLGAVGNGGSVTYIAPLPLEFAKGYGVLAAANASILPTLQMNTGTSASLYGTPPTTPASSMSVQVDSDFYWLPEGVDIEPPGLGTTRQWVLQQANPAVSANSSTRVQFPRLGGFLDTLIIEMRDSTGARNDGYWPTRLQILVDGVPWIDSDIQELFDDMAITWPGSVRPAGVLAVSRKTSLAQSQLGLLDTGEVFLSTNPGSLIEVNGSPWGNGSNSPALMNVLIGQVVPTGALVQGLPEV